MQRLPVTDNLKSLKEAREKRRKKLNDELVESIRVPNRVKTPQQLHQEVADLSLAVRELYDIGSMSDSAIDDMHHRLEILERNARALVQHLKYLVDKLEENGISV